MKTNLQQNKYKIFFGRNAILLAITALALLASPASRAAALCNCVSRWTDGIGDWFVQSNWDNVVPDCTGAQCDIPGPVEADINNGGTAQISSTPSPGYASACEVFLGKDSGHSGKLSVVGPGTLDQCNAMWVGYNGKGTLSITNGGSVSTDGAVGIAAETGSSGSATVDGTNSTWTFEGTDYVGGTINGAGGTGLLTVTNGGVVTAANVYLYKSGTLTGNGKVSTPDGGATTVEGTLAPNWTLTIDGDLTFAGAAPLMQCTVTAGNSGGIDAEVSGTATLTGKLSVTLNGFFTGDFTLLRASTLTNQFTSYSFTYTGCLSPSIRYVNGTDVVLHVESTCQ